MAEPFVEGLANLDSRSSLAMSSPITVAVPHDFIGQVLPEAVRDLRSAIPTARIRVLSGTKEEVFELVQTGGADFAVAPAPAKRSEEHTTALQSPMRTSYAVSFLKKKLHDSHLRRAEAHTHSTAHATIVINV